MTDLSLHDALALSLLPLETRRRVAGMLHAAYLDGFTEACRLCDGDDALWTEATHELAAGLGLTIGLRAYRALKRHFGLFVVEGETQFGSVGAARMETIRRTGK